MAANSNKLVLWFDEIGIEDVPLVGGKNASLGEMYRKLTKKGIRVPNGFAITAFAYKRLVEESGVQAEIRKVLKDLDTKDMANIAERGEKIRELILKTQFPRDLEDAIKNAYHRLCKQYNGQCDVAVRSSATAEDLPDASFAGQQETFLNVHGEYHLIEACRKCFASLFTNRAISYRVDKGFDHFKVYLSIGVQKMVRSDRACSGVMFTIDTESGFKDVVLITGSWGLGENVVQGAVNPDEFYVFKPTLMRGKRPILSKVLGSKKLKMVYSHDGSRPTKNIRTPDEERRNFVLSDDEILALAKWACIIESHYKKPMDIEWAKDGASKKLFIVQARPETIHTAKSANVLHQYVLTGKGPVLARGDAVGEKIGQGEAAVIKNVHDIE
ncbi:MAG: PEP/pyruvate-binding domain-containing protein, partial [Candidatus Altiarchaeota archaeon]|nr:PEP/pyruvate-binding domain-containing protein [Candidatus Altiarchaeota archaeon]